MHFNFILKSLLEEKKSGAETTMECLTKLCLLLIGIISSSLLLVLDSVSILHTALKQIQTHTLSSLKKPFLLNLYKNIKYDLTPNLKQKSVLLFLFI